MFSFAFTGSFNMFGGNLLVKNSEVGQRLKLISVAAGEIGVKETTNHNDGKRVEAYLSLVKLHKGQPWCAGFISWVFVQAGYAKPRSGWSPDLFPKSRLTKSVLPGNVLGVYFSELKRIAHVGLIEKQDHDWCVSIEGNTSVDGSIGGVYRKRRHLRTIYRIADWVSKERRGP